VERFSTRRREREEREERMARTVRREVLRHIGCNELVHLLHRVLAFEASSCEAGLRIEGQTSSLFLREKTTRGRKRTLPCCLIHLQRSRVVSSGRRDS
jgi:hypothetical protein